MLATCGLALALQFCGPAAIHLLQYDRASIAAGEWWRLLTAHLVHLNFHHALIDLGGLALLWALFARDLGPRAWALVIVATIAAIDCGLWVLDPGVSWYLGLSGVLHGILAAAIFVRLHRRDLEGWLLLALLLFKLGYEQIHGAMPFAGNMPVVVNAHLYGVLGGLVGALAVTRVPALGRTGAAATGSGRARED